MSVRRLVCAVAVAGSAIVLTGCMPKMTIEEMKAMMPERPAELDRLNAFAGKWVVEAEAKMAGIDEPMKSSGIGEATWEGDNWYLVNRGVFTMEGFDEMYGLETWTYDTKAKLYRTTWTGSMGSVGMGTGKYDEKTNTWHMKSTSYGPFGKSKAKGEVTFVDADTAEWTWTEYAMGGLMKTMEMTGTSRRQ